MPVIWEFNYAVLPEITGGPLGTRRYTFHTIEFHYGTAGMGTEHAINGGKGVLEVHFLFKNGNRWAIVAIMAKKNQTARPGINDLFNRFNKLEEKNTNIVIDSFTLPKYQLSNYLTFPVNQLYYTYNGTLLTPPCSRNVIWIIHAKIQEIALDRVSNCYCRLRKSQLTNP